MIFDLFDVILEAFCGLLGSGRAPESEFDIETLFYDFWLLSEASLVRFLGLNFCCSLS